MSAGPYIVTTKPPSECSCAMSEASLIGCEVHGYGAPDPDLPRESRVAVATLDEARHDAELALVDYKARTGDMPERRFILAARTLAESGGTVGPLPDGAVIEVAATTWLDLATDAGFEVDELATWARLAEKGDAKVQQRILDAYNARQETPRVDA